MDLMQYLVLPQHISEPTSTHENATLPSYHGDVLSGSLDDFPPPALQRERQAAHATDNETETRSARGTRAACTSLSSRLPERESSSAETEHDIQIALDSADKCGVVSPDPMAGLHGDAACTGVSDGRRLKSNKVCFFWYHTGECYKHDKCAFQHSITQDSSQVSWTTSRALRALHKGACGLPLCVYRDISPDEHCARKREGKKADKAETMQREGSHGRNTQPPKLNSVVNTDSKKRKAAVHHRDYPAAATKKSELEYAETQPLKRKKNYAKKKTCFLWYHELCKHYVDASQHGGCAHRHTLCDPPSMVQPPAGFVHAEPCDLSGVQEMDRQ